MQSFPTEVEEAIIAGQDKFAWETPAFTKYDRGNLWYFIFAIICFLLIAYAIWTANFLFAFIVFLSAIILLLVGSQDPRTVLVQIGDNGVVIDGRLHLFQDLERFSVIYQPPMSKVLYIEPRSSLTPRLRLELMDEDPVQLRDHLKRFLREDLDLQGEHVSDIFGRLLRI